MKYRIILLLGMLWTVLTGCTARVQAVQPTQTDSVLLDRLHSVGQTFVARYDGLSAILVNLSPGEAGDGELVLHLRAEATAEEDLAQVSMPLSRVTQAEPYRFDFSPINSSNTQYYYAVWEVVGAGSLEVGCAAGRTNRSDRRARGCGADGRRDRRDPLGRAGARDARLPRHPRRARARRHP